MTLFELVLGLLLVGAVLTTVAQRIGAPYPALLAVAGAVLALVPTDATATLDPELALALFVAPTLLDAAYDASPRDLRANWLPVTSLVLVAVGLTVLCVALVARLLVPGMPWSVAIVLGAIVAPPDASAASAVLRQLALPRRIVVILEGESLLNDASALLIYRIALGAATGAAVGFWSGLGALLLTCAGGAVFGASLAWLYVRVASPTRGDIGVSVVIQFVGTFAVWIAAERLGLSPVITTVAYAIALARQVPSRISAEHRRASYAVWEVAVFVLNALAFIMIGLQLKQVLSRLDGHAALTAGFATAVFLTVVGVRAAWVLGVTTARRRLKMGPPELRPKLGETVVVAWCGMRGIVTLATALALPGGDGGHAFPFRDLLIAAAFAVVLGTLVLQGLTLAPLMRWLALDDDGEEAREIGTARRAVAQVALDLLGLEQGRHADALRQEHEHPLPREGHALVLRIIGAKRRRLLQMRSDSTIGDNAFHVLEEELDWAEVHTSRRLRNATPAEAAE